MDTWVPARDQSSSSMATSAADESLSKHDDESLAQEAALEQLVDRINAARSVV